MRKKELNTKELFKNLKKRRVTQIIKFKRQRENLNLRVAKLGIYCEKEV